MKHGLQTKQIMRNYATLAGLLILIASQSIAFAAPPEKLSSGTSSNRAKKAAIESIPFDKLSPEARNQISPILKKPSIYRRLPITAIDVDPDYFVYLVRYPEVIVNIWKIMGVTQMVTKRSEPFKINTNDGAGTISNVELLYGTPNLHVFYGEGSYEGPVLKRRLHGRCVLVLRTEFRKNSRGEDVATSSMDVFLKVDNATASLIAKTLNPIVGRTADHNFIESLNFVQRLNDTTRKNGPGVQQMASRLTDISTTVRQDFVQMAGVVYERGEMLTLQNAQSNTYPTSTRRPSPPAKAAPAQRPASYPPTTLQREPTTYSRPAFQSRNTQVAHSYQQSQPGFGPSLTRPIPTTIEQRPPRVAGHYVPPVTQPSRFREVSPIPSRYSTTPGATKLPPIVGPRFSQRRYQTPNYPAYNYRLR